MSTPTQSKCGVCGNEDFDPFDPPPTVTQIQVGTTSDGKPIVRPSLNTTIRVDPETGAICWCPIG